MKVLVAGDFRSSCRTVDFIEKRNYAPIFQEIVPITQSADYSIVNFEAPVTLLDYRPIPKCGPNLKASVSDVEAVRYAGFNMATLANNHILDYGGQGLLDTVETCKKYNINTVGVGNNLQQASKIFYREIAGKTLAIINCCEHEFSIATDNSAGANPLNPIQQYYQIKEARQNANYVLVIVHGGHEHYQLPSLRMQETYRFFIDAGADAVVNHHQHCFSGYEYYNAKPIVYGLGNFCYDADNCRNSMWNEGYMAMLNVNEDNISLETIPYIQNNDVAGVFILKDRNGFDHKINELNNIIANRQTLIKKQKDYYQSQCHITSIKLEPYTNRILKALRMRNLIPSMLSHRKITEIQNIVECESHRDKLSYVIHQSIIK